MGNIRLLLILSLTFIMFQLWLAWQRDYPSPSTPPASGAVTDTEPRLPPPEEPDSRIDDTPPPAVSAEQPKDTVAAPEPSLARMFKNAETIRVQTDTVYAEIDTYGGDLRKIALLQYPVKVDKSNDVVTLFNQETAGFFVAQGGLLTDQDAPTHHSLFHAENTSYRMTEKDNSLEVRLAWRNQSQLTVNKIYTFTRGSYLIDVRYEVVNDGAVPWNGRLYQQLQRQYLGRSGFVYTFNGVALSSPEKR